MLVAVLALAFGPVGGAAFAAQTVNQCNDVDNTGGLGLTCDVTVTNNLNLATGVESSTVTIKECHGVANTVPSSCVGPTTTSYNTLTTSVNQCNYAANGGGSSVICAVRIVNNITGGASPTAATINQCNGSGSGGGTEPTLNCDPYPASTTNATITQCNESVNGGGGTMRVTCTVVPGFTQSAQLAVTVNQCNNSANGGGSIATCTTELTTLALPAAVTTPPAPAPKLPVVSG
ncbi:MAG: hypothetical protein ACSLE3_06945 [Microbacteriaceae bacterium]